jgi:hypothetical protein
MAQNCPFSNNWARKMGWMENHQVMACPQCVTLTVRDPDLCTGRFLGVLLTIALLAFEIFNFSTTEFALGDVLGNLSFAGIRWATLLSIAFCGIDFAGIARLFTPEQGVDGPDLCTG